MITRADLRDQLRNRLEDPTPAPLWPDASLHGFLADALHRYSARFPRQESESLVALGGEQVLPVTGPVGEREIVRVRTPDGISVPRSIDGDPAAGWTFWNGAIVLTRPAQAGTWTVEFLAQVDLPGDDSTPVVMPPGDAEIVVLLAASSALLRRSVQVGKRGMDASALALVRVAEAYERGAVALMGGRRRRAVGRSFG